MVEENGEECTQLENMVEALGHPISNDQPEYADTRDLLDEGRSSSLSDLEDGVEEVDLVLGNSPVARHIEADSEAETERLENSPNKNLNHNGIVIGHLPYTQSPSKLAQSALPQAAEQELFSDSGVSSPGVSDEDLESELRSENTAASDNGVGVEAAQIRVSSPRKRKHLEMEDDSGSERRLRRRTESMRSEADEETEPGLSREPTIEPMGDVPNDQDLQEDTSDILRNAQDHLNPKGLTDSNAKHSTSIGRGTLKDIAEEGQHLGKVTELGVDETRVGSDEEERVEGEDEDVEAVARDEEEYAKKMAAMDSLAALEKHFAALRDRLYDERIVTLNEELAQLSAPKPSHPEFLRQIECIRKYRDEKFDLEQKLLVYKIKSLKTKSVAQRSQIHSAYFQTVRDVREKHLDRIGEQLSRVRRDHVKTDEKIPSYSIPFPSRRSTQITQQSSYNKEVSILSGVAKYVGFPAAPSVKAALQAEMDEDMEKMGISLNHIRNSKPTQSKLSRSAFASTMSRPAAEEQFLEQNPWANPQHPVHQQQHTVRLSRHVSDQAQIADAIITPAAQKSLVDLDRPAGSASTVPEHLSAQASSASAKPYDHDGRVQQQATEFRAAAADQHSPAADEKPPQPRHRPQSLSPIEARKHNAGAYDATPSKPNSIGGAATGSGGAASQPYKPSRIALFSTPSRPESLVHNGSSNNEMGARHATSSPITLHQHARENNLTSTTGLSRIGAR
ncbi:hypothetical protein GJ744_003966 [Endocarpon pusillum]|uniref:Transcriptional regulatory protein DEP1 n=1 Tax=Endocarpon pusillum TaxID=364733 RepID=A0A8H7E0A6_9EURO|nr:hypothetical protein GJ744_003966 [Endocarpon pusillum]